MEQLNNLDVVFLIITGISALVGIARGMTKELLSLAGWVLAVAAVFYMVPLLDPVMQKYIASKILASVVSGMIILIMFCVVWILTVDKIAGIIRSSKLNALDRILGFMFGMFRGILIVVLIAMMITTLIPEESKKGVFAESTYFNEAAECAEPLKAMVPQSWIDGFKSKSESLGFGSDKTDKEAAEPETKDKETDAAKQEKTPEKTDTKPEKEKTDEKPQKENKPEKLLKDKFDSIDSNLEMLQKSGEELFNQLAQPKTAGSDAIIGEEALEDMSSDLDKLLDVLEDRVVVTESEQAETKPETQPETQKTK